MENGAARVSPIIPLTAMWCMLEKRGEVGLGGGVPRQSHQHRGLRVPGEQGELLPRGLVEAEDGAMRVLHNLQRSPLRGEVGGKQYPTSIHNPP